MKEQARQGISCHLDFCGTCHIRACLPCALVSTPVGSEGGEVGQREELDGDAVTLEVSPLQGALMQGWPTQLSQCEARGQALIATLPVAN